MRRFSAILFTILFAALFATGCQEKREKGGYEKVHWDRDMCERCKMVLSERKYAAQIVDPRSNRAYKFDDIGCAVLWLEEERIPWAKEAKIWVTDARSGEWIDARRAKYTDDSITPMAYGVAAFTQKTFPKGHKALNFDEVVTLIKKIERANNQKRGVE